MRASSSSSSSLTNWAFNQYSPFVGVSRQPIKFIIVDLPEPDGPMMATYSPRSMRRLTPRSACTCCSEPMSYVFQRSSAAIMQDCGGAETDLGCILITSAVAMFFSCSGATSFSEIKFDSEICAFQFETRSLSMHRLPAWTHEADEGYVSSSFLGAELSTLTLLPERSVRKIL